MSTTSTKFTERQRALQAAARRRGLSAIVIVGGVNLNYFSGFPAVERSMARPMLLVVPASGEPVMVAHRFRTQLIEAHSPVSKTIFYSQLSRPPVEALLEALKDAGADEGRIGFELSDESQIFISYGDFDAIRDALGRDRIADVGRDVWQIRFRRSDDEMACQSRAAQAVCDMFEKCWDFISEGTAQAELTRMVQRRALELGISSHYIIVSAGEDNYDFCGAWTPDKRFEKGEMVWIDMGLQVDGLCAAYSRAGVIGGASAEQKKVAEAVNEATRRGVGACGVGVDLKHVSGICEAELAKIDAPVTSDIAWFGTRFGHGMGLDFIEPPHIAPYDDTVLQTGMVLAVEPGIATSFGRFHFRQLVHVTDQGPELLPAPPTELATLKTKEQENP